jgi:DNA-directed RNA polymerase subunit K/omega
MKTKILSRGPEIDREICVNAMGTGMYDLILAATARAREIRRQHKTSDKFEHTHPCVTALLEIQNGTIDPKEYTKKVR